MPRDDPARRPENRAFIRSEFIGKELKLDGWPADVLAYAISVICLRILRYFGAIQVFSRQRRIVLTFDLSLKLLERGESIVIFVERREDGDYRGQTVFLSLLDRFSDRAGAALPLHLVEIGHRRLALRRTILSEAETAETRSSVLEFLKAANGKAGAPFH